MKKYLFSTIMFLMLMSISISVFSKPIYFGFRIAVKAAWEITSGECHDGNGLCLAIGNKDNPNNAELGYDDALNNLFYLKVSRSNEIAKYFSAGKFEIKEDSPIDPRLIALFSTFKNPDKKIVIIKKGVYPVKIEGECYVVSFNYYLR